MKRIANTAAAPYIRRREAFSSHTGNMSARWCEFAPWPERLPGEETVKLRETFKKGRPVYVVFSYATPIAWASVEGELYCPDVRYSRTTTCRHQPQVREAMA